MKIAKRRAFEGAPQINTPMIYGATTGKDFFYRIPVSGKRPIKLSIENMPNGLKLENGIIYGKFDYDTEFEIEIIAENDDGETRKPLKIRVAFDGVLLTPLMGFSTWNGFGAYSSQKLMEKSAEQLIETGIADYGYSYLNIDSGWQSTYGGKYNAVMPNNRFPNMKEMCDNIHKLGLKCGIYSTPMLTAWGCPNEFETIPGCTVGKPDPRFPDVPNGGIGTERREKNNVMQWNEWGFDYLKYDWLPADSYNGTLMKQELLNAKREIAFCVTVRARIEDAEFFENNVNSWRDNEDTLPTWENILERTGDLDKWGEHVKLGHFYDLDILAIGKFKEDPVISTLTENEEAFAYTMRAFFASPIQISAPIEEFTDYELDLICNEEIIAINQDVSANYPALVRRDRDVLIYKRTLYNNDIAYAVFNLKNNYSKVPLNIPANTAIRDVWLKENLIPVRKIMCDLEPHGVKVYRVTLEK